MGAFRNYRSPLPPDTFLVLISSAYLDGLSVHDSHRLNLQDIINRRVELASRCRPATARQTRRARRRAVLVGRDELDLRPCPAVEEVLDE